MAALVSYDSASSALEHIDFNLPSPVVKKLYWGMQGFAATQFGSMQMVSLSTMVIEGLVFTNNECIGLSWLPDFDNVSGGLCVVFSLATMLVTSGFLSGISAISIAVLEARQRQLLKKHVHESSYIYRGINTLDYNHYGSLTLWHRTMASYGLETGLVETPAAVYYTYGNNLFAANATSWVTGTSGNKLYVQHGLSASRSYVYLNSTLDSFPEEEAASKQDEVFGYEIDCCHASGGASSNEHSDWEAVNALAKYFKNETRATDSHSWELLFSDLEYKDTLITGLANAEQKDFDTNKEWSERELCQSISQQKSKCVVKPFKYTV